MTINVLLYVFSAHKIAFIYMPKNEMVTGYTCASFSRYCQKFPEVVIPNLHSLLKCETLTFFPSLDNVRFFTLILVISLVEISF